MDRSATLSTTGWNDVPARLDGGSRAADLMLRVVDGGLFAIICLAPFLFGGRHDAGRLILVSLIAVTSVAWFARQAVSPTAQWPRTFAYGIFVLAAALLVLQIVPLPAEWTEKLSPRTAELLPLWTPGGSDAASLGSWQTLSLTPHETTKSLAMLASYGLLFVVVAGRIQCVADVERLLKCVALAAVLMAIFGIVHFFTTDGRFFWLYAYPHRSATRTMSGAFINRNHFAHFLVLGTGPLVAWLLYTIVPKGKSATFQSPQSNAARRLGTWVIAAAIAIVLAAVFVSRSRGGALALLAGGIVLLAIYRQKRVVDTRFVLGLAGLAVAVVGLLSLYGYDQVVRRLDDFAEGSMEDLDHGGIRRKIWAANLNAIQAGGLTGAGAGSHREICPAYLQESFTKEYTYAENGYLQVATETGYAGTILLAFAIGVCGAWCLTCMRHATQKSEVYLFGAAAAGLAASAAHSIVDFVWYIPACMSVTIVLAGCVLRLSQLARAANDNVSRSGVIRRGRWLELTAAAILVGAWAVHTYVGPGVAAIHWDRYRRASISETEVSQKAFAKFAAGGGVAPNDIRKSLSQGILRHLQAAVSWDPRFARAHKQLAERYLAEFDIRLNEAANVLDIKQIRDAATVSSFSSKEELHDWLGRAFGPDVKLLSHAQAHARRAVEISPLQGGAYLHLADLAFLDLGAPPVVQANVEQALRVRPYDRNVLANAGVQFLLLGNIERAFDCWSKCFNTPGSHQQRIIYQLVASGMPANEFLARLRPDWRTLRQIWAQYRKSGRPQDLNDLLCYTEQQTQKESADTSRVRSAYVWLWQAELYGEVGRHDEALRCLERAYACNPREFNIRSALAKALLDVGRFAEAEPHVRWCLARRPSDKTLRAALLKISESKQRLAQREPDKSSPNKIQTNAPPIEPSGMLTTKPN